MKIDWQQLAEMAPLLIGAMQGPSPEGAATMQGFVAGQQHKQSLAEKERERKRQELMDALTQQNTLADNRRADASLDLTRQNTLADNTRADATLGLNRQQTFRTMGAERATQLADQPGADPLQSQNQLAGDLFKMSKATGVDPGMASTVLPNMSGMIAERDKKHYREQFDKVSKDPMYAGLIGTPEFDNMTVKDRKGQLIKIKDIKAQLGEQLMDPSGQPVPASPKATGTETERAADLLDKIASATDPAAKAKFQGQYDRLIAAKKAIGQADDKAASAPRQRFNIQPITNQDGTTGLVRINMETGETTPVALPDGAGSGRDTDTQRLSAAYLKRTTASDVTALGFESKLTSLGRQFNAQLPNLLKSPDGRRYKQAEDEFINAALRRESGAAIQQSEYDRFEKIYFVRPGDDPSTITQKQEARKRVLDGFRVAAGNLAGKAEPTAPKKQVRYGADGKPLP